MSDQDSPEVPKPNTEAPQGKGAFGWYNPPEGPSKPLADLEGDSSSPSSTAPETDQEALFRAAAIKCARLEEEIGKIVAEKFPHAGDKRIKIDSFTINTAEEDFGTRYVDIEFEDTPILGCFEKPADIQFTIYDDSNAILEGVGVQSKYSLTLEDYYSDPDQDNLNALKEYAEKGYANPTTNFYFDLKGSYSKSTLLPADFDPPNELELVFEGSLEESLDSEYAINMELGDFEVAGQALAFIKDTLLGKPAE